MKLRNILILGAVSGLLLFDSQRHVRVFAETLSSQQVVLAQGNSSIKGSYSSRVENEQLILSFSPDANTLDVNDIRELTLEINQGNSISKHVFKQIKADLFEIVLDKALLTKESKLAVTLQTSSAGLFVFEGLKVNLPVENTTTTEVTTTETTVTESDTTVTSTTESKTSEATTTAQQEAGATAAKEANPAAKTSPALARTVASTSEATTTTASSARKKVETVIQNAVALTAHEGKGTFDILISNLSEPSTIKSVQAAVWSVKNGQDDLKWYPVSISNSSGKATINIQNHGNQTDNYIVHVYIQYKNGALLGIDAGNIAIQKVPSNHEIVTNFDKTGLQIALKTNQSFDLRNVKFAIWGEKNGQDDLKWYSASSTGTLSIPYKNLAGFDKYQVHAYLDQNRRMNGLTTTSTTLTSPTVASSVSKVNDAKYKIEIKNVPAYITSIQVPVWSDNKGQDDIKWYTANKKSDNSYEVIVNIGDHKGDTGKYHAHIYGKSDMGNSTIGLAITPDFKVDSLGNAKGNVVVKNVNHQNGSFDVLVTDIVAPAGLKEILVPIWSKENGQDDLKWYSAKKQSDGSYKVSVSASNHKFSNGDYLIHTYLKDDAGKLSFLNATTTSLNLASFTGNIALSPVNPNDYTFVTTISNVGAFAGIKAVKVAVWSEADGQNDLRWYTATKLSSNQYTALIRLANHYYSNGTYQVHVYYELNNGKTIGLGASSLNVTTPAPRAYVQQELRNLVNQFHAAFAGVGGQKSLYITATDGIDTVSYNDSVQRSASTIKLFIMAAAYAKAERGELNLSTRYTVRSSDIVMNSLSLQGAVGKTYTLADIARFMMETSDNSATNIVMRHIGGVEAVNAEIRRMGYTKTYLQRYMHDQPAIAAGLDNYINAQEAGDLLRNIFNRTLVTPNLDNQMVQNLSNNYWSNWLPANIKGKAYVIDKPGNHVGLGIENDVAIISKNGRSYSVAILTQGTGSTGFTLTPRFAKFGEAVLAELSN